MKRIIFLLSLSLLFSCKEDLQIVEPVDSQINTGPYDEGTQVGMYVDENWFQSKFPGYKKIAIRWYGYGDFNKDGLKDIVCVFASNGTREYNYQDDSSKRIVVGVFLNRKTFFRLDTNLVYSVLGGWNGANVADVDNDGDLDIYHMSGGWEGSSRPRPSYYVGNGNGAMDSFLFINENNKSLKKVVLPVGGVASIYNSILFDRDNNGLSEVYLSNGDYYEYDGTTVTQKKFNIVDTFKGVKYDLRVVTPKFANKKYGLIFLASDNFTDTYFVLKAVGNDLIPIIKYDVPITKSGFTDATNGERDELYVEDLDNDGNPEYVIPSQIFNTTEKPCIPYLQIIDSNGNDATSKFLDSGINNPLKPEQFNASSILSVTGFIFYTFADIDDDGIKEIFPASGLGYLENNNTYCFKLVNGKYTKVLYNRGWYGNVTNESNKFVTYWPFIDEKNRVIIFHIGEGSIDDVIIKNNPK
jgi:hypothetical protein